MLNRRRALLLLVPVFAVAAEAQAAGPPTLVSSDGGLSLATGDQARSAVDAQWSVRPPRSRAKAWTNLQAATGPAWASWDDVTAVPSRIMISVPAPGTISDPSEAEAFSVDFLAQHIDLLAPGADPSDFVVVANDLSDGMRSVGLAQFDRGIRVVGGQVSFRFKNDNLMLIGSEAFPNIALPLRTSSTVATTTGRERARDWVRRDISSATVTAEPASGPFVLPIVRASGVEYREVLRVNVEAHAPRDRFEVWVDSETGEPVARRSTLLHASATLLYNVPVRSPELGRADLPAPDVFISSDEGQLTSDALGGFFFTAPTIGITTGVDGSDVVVVTEQGELTAGTFTATDGGTVTWDQSSSEFFDAQLTTYVHATLVKSYIRNIDPNLELLQRKLVATVNIDDECNAFSDGTDIFFYASGACQNTGLLADVIYHEYGHSVHNSSIIEGVGRFNGALSEGVSDYLSATMTGDSGLARGFFFDDTPLRELDPPGEEYRWPEGRGEVHSEGRIIGGTLWDLRTLLIAKHGAGPGVAISDQLYYQAHRRAIDIPSMYPEVLAADDDDGNLANGTPNACEINQAFGVHGLFSAGKGAERVTVSDVAAGHEVRLELSIPDFPDCPVAAAPTFTHRTRGDQASQVAPMTPSAGGWVGVAPARVDGEVLQYQVRVNYSTGTEKSLPDNFVDPWYEHYVGPVTELYCMREGQIWDFEEGGNWAQPGNLGGESPLDPTADFDGDGVTIGQDGDYPGFSNTRAYTPEIDTSGFSTVRLQYRRWLTVEDGFFDQATILADETQVWSNFGSGDEDVATLHHDDKEWRFHDVDITDEASDGSVQISFGLVSDAGLHFGGWTIDALCVVGVDGGLCGNGIVEEGEECDDGNLTPFDGCDASCANEGGGEEDTGDTGTDDGFGTETDTDGFGQDDNDLVGRGCGCQQAGRNPFAALFVLVIFGLARRRRDL